jgi:hypothetical protein
MINKIVFVISLAASCFTLPSVADQPPEYLRPYQTQGFPNNDRMISFEQHSATFPPKPIGLIETTHPIAFHALPARIITPERSRAFVRRLISLPAIRRPLGRRYILIGVGLAEPETKGAALTGAQLRATFFDYDGNRAIEVVDRGLGTPVVTPLSIGYQPPETTEEIAAAAKITRAVPHIRAQIVGREVTGILTPAPDHHRCLYLIFHDPNGHREPFVATVDMTRQAVLRSGVMPRFEGT